MRNDALQVRHNQAKSRYEVEVDGKLALIEYRDAGGVRYYTHTEVPEALEGRGIDSVQIYPGFTFVYKRVPHWEG